MMETHLLKIKQTPVEGELKLPKNPIGLIVFAHGSGSSRFSPRNKLIADYLNENGFGTFLFDLLSEEEDQDFSKRFDIPLLSERLILVTQFLKEKSNLKKLRFGYFGASTGAATALVAASKLPNQIHAVVSRGGRPDLAHNFLQEVSAPTLLIVGQLDFEVLELNQKAFEELSSEKSLKIIPGATHLFEEPGTMDQVAKIALDWFITHLKSGL
jgi:pimeloyl-ACP methyl ester carboxylesterase